MEMIYVDELPEYWSMKWGLEIETMTCSACKKDFIADVPIAMRGYRGFEMRAHGCPANRLSANFTPIGEERKEWQNIVVGERLNDLDT